MDDLTDLQSPSNAIKLGFELKRMLHIKIGVAIEKGTRKDRDAAEDLLKLMEMFWGTRVTKNARVILSERNFNKRGSLPAPDDIKKLNIYLKEALQKIDYSNHTYESYISVVELVQAKLTLYNRRRTGELEAAQ